MMPLKVKDSIIGRCKEAYKFSSLGLLLCEIEKEFLKYCKIF